MAPLTFRNGISIALLVIYLPILLLAAFLSKRHGFGRSSGWIYLVLFCFFLMFRSRISSQKPGEELYAHFKANFGNVLGASTAGTSSGDSSLDAVVSDPSNLESYLQLHGICKLAGGILRTHARLAEYNTSQSSRRPADTKNRDGKWVGDSFVDANMRWGRADDGLCSISASLVASELSPSANLQPTQLQPQQQSYAPAIFMHQHPGYETMDLNDFLIHDSSRIASLDLNRQHQSPTVSRQSKQLEMSVTPPPTSAEKSSFHAVLNAPTAMIKHIDETPVTYLNKGQTYLLSIVDTTPIHPVLIGSRYRTSVRISFDDEQQRQRPATCWQLWKEGRGTDKAHQRGGKLRAVEYVEASQPADSDEKPSRVELDIASLDGFSVIWTPEVNGLMECSIVLRFNFVSTDFSHFKGIELYDCAPERKSGTSGCLLLFPTRPRSPTVKLKQQITQSETGMKGVSEHKRIGFISKPALSQRAGKVQKHKLSRPLSSASSAADARLLLEEDLHLRLRQQQDIFTSTRPVSILHLRGAEQDDPDLHPVALPGKHWDLMRVNSQEGGAGHQRRIGRSSTADSSSLVSSSHGSVCIQSREMIGTSIPGSFAQWTEDHIMLGAKVQGSIRQQLASSPGQVMKIPKIDDAGSLNGWIGVLGVDADYRPPAERPIKSVACFYVLYRDPASRDKQQYYRADLVTGIAAKWNIESTRILQVIHVPPGDVEVEMDDDIVREMLEGQDVQMEVSKVAASKSPVKCEWEMAVDGEEGIIDSATQDDAYTEGYEIWGRIIKRRTSYSETGKGQPARVRPNSRAKKPNGWFGSGVARCVHVQGSWYGGWGRAGSVWGMLLLAFLSNVGRDRRELEWILLTNQVGTTGVIGT
ncbi:hypothetical protein V500_03915 [Pseudogymnoascus sp. VKM F-4518 (FW-2643)]|nr:hypothetical protein V500_03915 [Pseudogymnoascus sp. VKM F-4518 (FW-2643)]